MGQALTQYAQVLAEQQQRATQAQAELEQAKEQARSAAEAHNAQIDAGNPPAQPFQDPTAETRAQAQHTIARAKDTVAAAGDRAAATMRSAAARAPAQPGVSAKAAGWVSDFASRNVQAVGGMATGFGQAVAGLGGLALGAFKAELYFGFGGALIDPEEAHDMVNGVTSTASAAVSSPADGLHDHAAWAAAGTVPWSNIVAANVITIGWQSQLAVGVRDPQAVVDNTSGLRRLMLAANARMSTPVNIPGIVLPVRPAELATEINSHVAMLSRSTADRGTAEHQ